jgi:hypothetical protein
VRVQLRQWGAPRGAPRADSRPRKPSLAVHTVTRDAVCSRLSAYLEQSHGRSFVAFEGDAAVEGDLWHVMVVHGSWRIARTCACSASSWMLCGGVSYDMPGSATVE